MPWTSGTSAKEGRRHVTGFEALCELRGQDSKVAETTIIRRAARRTAATGRDLWASTARPSHGPTSLVLQGRDGLQRRGVVPFDSQDGAILIHGSNRIADRAERPVVHVVRRSV